MSNTNQVEVTERPNSHVEAQYYNKALGLIAEIVDGGFGEYLVEFFKLGRSGEYVKVMKSDRVSNLGSAAVVARRYATSGDIL
jgi:hypothetical protein